MPSDSRTRRRGGVVPNQHSLDSTSDRRSTEAPKEAFSETSSEIVCCWVWMTARRLSVSTSAGRLAAGGWGGDGAGGGGEGDWAGCGCTGCWAARTGEDEGEGAGGTEGEPTRSRDASHGTSAEFAGAAPRAKLSRVESGVSVFRRYRENGVGTHTSASSPWSSSAGVSDRAGEYARTKGEPGVGVLEAAAAPPFFCCLFLSYVHMNTEWKISRVSPENAAPLR